MTEFPESYASARNLLFAAADRCGAEVGTCFVGGDKELAVDIVSVGESGAPTLVISSGLHGVEGFFGSAVQLALLEKLASVGLKGLRYVLVHALNPYGYKNVRRFDERNIDLNRNFLLTDETYLGAPEGYATLHNFLNPESPPNNRECYRLKAIWNIARHGLPSLKASVVCGQFEYPKGIFFGGVESSGVKRLIEKHYDDWLQNAERVLHIDLHTGLGAFGSYKLLLNEEQGSDNYHWYATTFSKNNVEPLQGGIAYPVRGSMGSWLQSRYQNSNFRFVGAEFGTYGPVRVLGSIRAENRAHHYAPADSRAFKVAKAELLECFCPKSPSWRNTVIKHSMDIIASATNGLVQCGQSNGQSS